MKLQSIVKSVAAWLGAERKPTSRRSVRRPALRLESLEARDCPSTFGDAMAFQNDLNYLAANQWAPDSGTLQNDINQVLSAAQYGQAGLAVQNLQGDMNSQSSMWGSYALSSSYTLQNDLQNLLNDVNGGYGSSSGSGSGGGNIYSSNPYPVGSMAYNLQNAAMQKYAENGGQAGQSTLNDLLSYGDISGGMAQPSYLQGVNQGMANWQQNGTPQGYPSSPAPQFNYFPPTSTDGGFTGYDPFTLFNMGGPVD